MFLSTSRNFFALTAFHIPFQDPQWQCLFEPYLSSNSILSHTCSAQRDEGLIGFSGGGVCSRCCSSCHKSQSNSLRFLRQRRPKADNSEQILVWIDTSQWWGIIYAIIIQVKLQCFSQCSHRLRCRQYWQHWCIRCNPECH